MEEILKVCEYIIPIAELTLDEANNHFLDQLNSEDIVVLDNYYYTTEYQQAIKDKGCKLVCIDDMHDRHMVCDLLLTSCPISPSVFSKEGYTQFAGGIEWAFLREEFFQPLPIRDIPSTITKIVMAMGGADAFNLTNKMVEVVHSVVPDVEINVICGETVTVSNETRGIANIHRSLSAGEIVQLFDTADMGIFPASTISIEAFSRKLPVIAGWYVDNQKEFYDYGTDNGLFAPLGCLLDEAEEIKKRLHGVMNTGRPLPVVIDFKSQREKIINLFKSL